MAGHEIVKCSCGTIIRQCRCIGPHTVRVVDRGCDACLAVSARLDQIVAALPEGEPGTLFGRPMVEVPEAEFRSRAGLLSAVTPVGVQHQGEVPSQ